MLKLLKTTTHTTKTTERKKPMEKRTEKQQQLNNELLEQLHSVSYSESDNQEDYDEDDDECDDYYEYSEEGILAILNCHIDLIPVGLYEAAEETVKYLCSKNSLVGVDISDDGREISLSTLGDSFQIQRRITLTCEVTEESMYYKGPLLFITEQGIKFPYNADTVASEFEKLEELFKKYPYDLSAIMYRRTGETITAYRKHLREIPLKDLATLLEL